MKLHAKTCAFALGLTLAAALAGCSGSEQASRRRGARTRCPHALPLRAPAQRLRRPARHSRLGQTAAKADRPEITEKPAESTPTPKEATHKGGVEKGEVKKEEPPKGA